MCKLCNQKPVYVFTNKRQVCKACFIRWFQSKVLYTIKKFSMAKKGDVIGYRSEKGFRDVVLEDVLRYYGSRAPIEVVRLSDFSPTNSCPDLEIDKKKLAKVKTLAHPNKLGIIKLAVPHTTDMESIEIINNLINSKLTKENLPVKGKLIKPLYLFLDKEVLLYAKLKKLKFTKVVEKKEKMNVFLNEMEKKHPEVKRAIVNSYLTLSG